MKKSLVIKLVIGCALALCLSACGEDDDSSPEEQVSTIVTEIEQAIERRSTSDIFDHVSDQYSDHRGQDQEALRKLARVFLLRHQNINLITNIQKLEVLDDTTVTIEASVLMGGTGPTGSVVGARADSQNVSAVFQLEGNDYRLVSLSWDGEPAL